MEDNNTVCPVCTLYLRPGITLKSHLNSHPKQKVIEALVRISSGEHIPIENTEEEEEDEEQWAPQSIQQNIPQVSTAIPASSQRPSGQGNHVYIYQQSMSTGPAPQNLSLNTPAQYVIPTVFNPPQPPQGHIVPYVYQQQHVIMSTSAGAICATTAGPTDLTSQTKTSDDEVEIQNEVVENVEQVNNDLIEEQEHEPAEISKVTIEIAPKEISISPTNYVIKKSDEKLASLNNETNIVYDGEKSIPSTSSWGTLENDTGSKQCQNEPSRIEDTENRKDYYYLNESGYGTSSAFNSTTISQDEGGAIDYSSSAMQNSTENIDYVDMDGNYYIIGEFATNPIISQVANFESTRLERPGVLMNIGESSSSCKIEDISHLNIRADEKMPPRGELSGQESMGSSSDITWNRLQYGACSYDVTSQDNDGSWHSDAGESDYVDHLHHPVETKYLLPDKVIQTNREDDATPARGAGPEDDTPTMVSYSPPPLNFKCSVCGDAFKSLKDRKLHDLRKHPEKRKTDKSLASTSATTTNMKFKVVKKLIIRPKATSTKVKMDENNDPDANVEGNSFVFTNKLKVETLDVLAVPATDDDEMDLVPNVPNCDLRTVCTSCNEIMPNSKCLKVHRQQIHGIEPTDRFKCTTCQESFLNDYKYTEHLKVHPLECSLCGKLFYRRQNLNLHMKRHFGIKPFKCSICIKSFLTRQKLEEHVNTHTGNTPIKCTLCDERFKRYSNLVQHRNRHHLKMKKKQKDYVCFCGEFFHSLKKLAWHKETHENKPKACPKCPDKFIHMSSLTRHMRRAHNERYLPKPERETENVECPVCKGVYLRSSLEAHMKNHTGVRPFQCLICSKEFTTRWNLKLHKWTHASRISKPFKCDQCKGAFIRETDYISHMNSHKSIKPYTCNYCGAQFIRKYNCQRHVREHENVKTFNCKVCGKSFHRSYYLKDHMRVHSGIRPFTCHVCGKTSTTKSNHNKHVQIHHAREPVSTEN